MLACRNATWQYSIKVVLFYDAYAKIKSKEYVLNEQGYTLLEVTLFLAISGLLALVAFIGLGPRLRNVRFTEAVRSLESSIQRNLAESNLGSRQMSSQITCQPADSGGGLSIQRDQPGGSQSGATGSCVLNGRVAIIEQGNITYREIVSLRESAECAVGSAFQAIAECHRATVLSNDQQSPITHNYNNGVQAISGLPSSAVQGYGYVVHPADGSRIIFRYQQPDSTGGGILLSEATEVETNPSSSLDVCYALSSRRAQITFSNQTLTPIVNFEGC